MPSFTDAEVINVGSRLARDYLELDAVKRYIDMPSTEALAVIAVLYKNGLSNINPVFAKELRGLDLATDPTAARYARALLNGFRHYYSQNADRVRDTESAVTARAEERMFTQQPHAFAGSGHSRVPDLSREELDFQRWNERERAKFERLLRETKARAGGKSPARAKSPGSRRPEPTPEERRRMWADIEESKWKNLPAGF